MEHKKDYSLLRPFDLEAAKQGDEIMREHHTSFIAKMAAISKDGRSVFAEFSDGSATCFPSYAVKMAPLAWVEGKPVYKGDVLYQHGDSRSFRITGYEAVGGGMGKPCLTYGNTRQYVERFTWTPPMVKREGWGIAFVEGLAQSREEAEAAFALRFGRSRHISDGIYGKPRVARIEWEEPAGEKK